MEALGLVAQHSYGLLKAAEPTDEDGNKIRLVLLRNPWGDFEWNGDWSDKSDKWTPSLKRQLGWSEADDGTFWMDLNVYLPFYLNSLAYIVGAGFSLLLKKDTAGQPLLDEDPATPRDYSEDDLEKVQ